MAFFFQFLQQLNSSQREEQYAMQTLGFRFRPTIVICGHIQRFMQHHSRFPSLSELAAQIYEPCYEDCECYVPFTESIQILEHVLVQYGFFVRCSTVHFIYMYLQFENRFPTRAELFAYIEESSNSPNHISDQQITQMMADDVEEYWNHRHSSAAPIPSHTLSQEEHKESISCCICQDEIKEGEQVVTLPCHHTFHSAFDQCAGIEHWIEKAGNCPLCKRPVQEEQAEEIPEVVDQQIVHLINELMREEMPDVIEEEMPDLIEEEMPDLIDEEEMPDLMDEDNGEELVIEFHFSIEDESDNSSESEN